MLQGDIDISTVTILQSLINKIDDTLNSCENSDTSPCTSTTDSYNNIHSTNTNVLSNTPMSDDTSSSASVVSPAAYEEVHDTANPIKYDNNVADTSCYDSLANYIRICSNINNVNILSEMSSNLQLSDISEPEVGRN